MTNAELYRKFLLNNEPAIDFFIMFSHALHVWDDLIDKDRPVSDLAIHKAFTTANIVAELTTAGMSDAWILRHVGMDKDELLRLKQITGLAALFKDASFSEAISA